MDIVLGQMVLIEQQVPTTYVGKRDPKVTQNKDEVMIS